jgi:hypothetical protein
MLHSISDPNDPDSNMGTKMEVGGGSVTSPRMPNARKSRICGLLEHVIP